MSADEPQGDEFEVQRRHPYATIPDALITDLAVKELAVRVFCLIDRYVGSHAGAWPSRATLAKRLKKGERTIDAALANLCATGWLEVRPRRRRDGSRASSLYILSDSPEAAAAVRVTNGASKAKRDAKAAERKAAKATNAPNSARCEPQNPATDNAPDLANNNAPDSAGHERTPDGTNPTSSPLSPQPTADTATAAPPEEGQSARVIDLPETERRRRRGPQTFDTTANRSDVQAICDHLAQRVGTYSWRQPEITHTWRDAARRLLDIDKASPHHVHLVIDWATADQHWSSIVITPVKLREHYTTLWIKAKYASEQHQGGQRGGRPTPIQNALNIEALGQQMAEEDARRAALTGNDQFEVTA